MKRSEEIRQKIAYKEQSKVAWEKTTRAEINILNKQIASLNRELDEIRNGGKLNEEI